MAQGPDAVLGKLPCGPQQTCSPPEARGTLFPTPLEGILRSEEAANIYTLCMKGLMDWFKDHLCVCVCVTKCLSTI